jgi:hypothetical protein
LKKKKKVLYGEALMKQLRTYAKKRDRERRKNIDPEIVRKNLERADNVDYDKIEPIDYSDPAVLRDIDELIFKRLPKEEVKKILKHRSLSKKTTKKILKQTKRELEEE